MAPVALLLLAISASARLDAPRLRSAPRSLAPRGRPIAGGADAAATTAPPADGDAAAVFAPLPSANESAVAHTWTPAETLKRYSTKLDEGLSAAEAGARRSVFGANVLVAAARKTRWAMLCSQFEDRLVQILVVVAIFSGVLGVVDAEDPTAWVDPVVICLILLSNAAVGVWQESSADGALDALKKLQPDRCCCRRRGAWDGEVPASDLAPGDVVYLRVGDKVPADVRLLQLRTSTFATDEAALTGESYTVMKSVDAVDDPDCPLGTRTSMAFAGTVVTGGHAIGVVAATGMATQIGRIQAGVTAAAADQQKTPLSQKLDEFGHQLTLIIGSVCALTFGASVPRFDSPIFGSKLRGAMHYAKGAVALGVAAIPEGLPAVITLCLSLGTRRMAQRRVVVRRLPSVETLGCTSVICSDKTGTLTTNQMTAVSLLLPAEPGSFEELEVTGLSYDPTDGEVVGRPDLAESHAAAFAAAAVCALCNDAQLAKDPKTGQFVRVGEPTEAALKVLCEKLGAPKSLDASPEAKQAGPWHRASLAWAGAYERTATLEFDRGRKSMSVVCKRNGSYARLFVKGAPDSVLARCSRVLDPATGSPRKLEDGERAELAKQVTAMAGRPLRCLALAYTDDLPPELQAYEGSDEDADLPACLATADDHEKLESDLVLAGVVGIRDPPRPECAAAIAKCKAAGVRVFMITGDSRETAVAIGRELGILDGDGDGRAWEGNAFFADDSDDAEAARAATLAPDKGNGVFCRTAPADKQRIIKLLSDAHGDVTAMTGDGVNDAPALQQASIGIAMGITGTEVAKQAADMVLMDDDFATIVAAVEEGRAIYKNMQAFVCFLLSCNFGEVATIFGATLMGIPDVLTPLQLLWVNLVTDGPPATALGFNPPDPDAMTRPPRDSSAPILTPWLLCRYAVTGAYVGFATIQIFLNHFKDHGVSRRQLSRWASCDVDDAAWATFAPVLPPNSHANPCAAAFGTGSLLKAKAQTLSLSTLVTMEMLKALSAVSLDHSLLRVSPLANRWLLAGVALPTLLHLGLLYVPQLCAVFGLEALSWAEWATVLKFAAPILVVEELTKAVGRHLEARALREARADAK